MFVALHALWLAATAPRSLGPRPARVVEDFAGLTWHVRSRTPALHYLLIGTVELSTELLVLVALGVGGAPEPLARLALPIWAGVQLAVMAVAASAEVGGRCKPARVRITPSLVRLGSRAPIRASSVVSAEVHCSGWGPLHRAELRLVHRQGNGALRTTVIAADGDEGASLRSLAAYVQRAPAAAPAGPALAASGGRPAAGRRGPMGARKSRRIQRARLRSWGCAREGTN